MSLRKNITGTVTTELLASGKKLNAIKEISITAISAAVGSLYIGNSSDTFYLIKDTEIPAGVVLTLDSQFLKFDNSSSGYGLFIKLASGAVDVCINR